MKNQDHSDEFSHGTINAKRKWYFDQENILNSPQDAKTLRKSVGYDYENYQPNHQIASTVLTTSTISYNDNMNKLDHNNDIELSESVEYVNILYENNLLSSVQSPITTESNYINFEANWTNTDILDLDERNYYYEAETPCDQRPNVEQIYHPDGNQNDPAKQLELQDQLSVPTVVTTQIESSRK